MKRKVYIGLMVLPVCLFNSTLGLASSNLSSFQYMLPMTIAHNTVATKANFPPGLHKKIQARDDQTEDCLRLGICKD
jgi:hypothetical protein